MPRLTVQLEHQAIADEQIHESDTRDPHLGPHADSALTEREPGKGLEPGLAGAVHMAEGPPSRA